jgi:hypothetical protein
MRRFPRMKGSLERKRNRKKRRAMRREIRKMSRFQTMTWSIA